MQRAHSGWVACILVVAACLAITACEPKGSTGSAAAGARPAVKVSSEPMKPEDMGPTARAVLQPAAPTPGFSGTVTFTQVGSDMHVVADVAGVTPAGKHGIHLHETGQCDHDQHFTSAGGHFNPTGAPHACPDAASHHAGDFGNIDIQADGTGHLDITTPMLSLSGANTVIGRAVILHAGTDDCTSQPAGNSGARQACGVVSAPAAAGGAGSH
jgi:Cu-Zn family superoxide dismutase